MDEPLTPDQFELLIELGLTDEQIAEFAAGIAVVFPLETESTPGIAVIQATEDRLRCGIVAINDPGGGPKSLLRFRGKCLAIVKALGLAELELFGVAMINREFERALLRHGFVKREEECPEALGGGRVNIVTRTWLVH